MAWAMALHFESLRLARNRGIADLGAQHTWFDE